MDGIPHFCLHTLQFLLFLRQINEHDTQVMWTGHTIQLHRNKPKSLFPLVPGQTNKPGTAALAENVNYKSNNGKLFTFLAFQWGSLACFYVQVSTAALSCTSKSCCFSSATASLLISQLQLPHDDGRCKDPSHDFITAPDRRQFPSIPPTVQCWN